MGLVPSYFNGTIALGTMFQIEGVVGGVRSSLDFFIGAYGDIAMWHAAASRMLALERVNLDAPSLHIPKALTVSPDSGQDCCDVGMLEADGLSIVAGTSGGTSLLENVSFRWNLGD